MRTAEFVRRYPQLFHMTSARAWPTIQRHGLRSVTAILDLLHVDPDERGRIENQHRPATLRLADAGIGAFEIRDQKPLHLGKLERCLTGMSVSEWLALLNRKVFFWPTEERVQELLGASEYRARDHLVLVVRTESLVAIHGPEITLARSTLARFSTTRRRAGPKRSSRSRATPLKNGDDDAGHARRLPKSRSTTRCPTS